MARLAVELIEPLVQTWKRMSGSWIVVESDYLMTRGMCKLRCYIKTDVEKWNFISKK